MAGHGQHPVAYRDGISAISHHSHIGIPAHIPQQVNGHGLLIVQCLMGADTATDIQYKHHIYAACIGTGIRFHRQYSLNRRIQVVTVIITIIATNHKQPASAGSIFPQFLDRTAG